MKRANAGCFKVHSGPINVFIINGQSSENKLLFFIVGKFYSLCNQFQRRKTCCWFISILRLFSTFVCLFVFCLI